MATLRQEPDHHLLHGVQSALWALCGAVVLLFIFFAALGAVDPAEAEALTAGVLVLAVAWLAHNWRRLWRDEREAGR